MPSAGPCTIIERNLEAYIYAELPPDLIGEFKQHLKDCGACQSAAGQFVQSALFVVPQIPPARPIPLDGDPVVASLETLKEALVAANPSRRGRGGIGARSLPWWLVSAAFHFLLVVLAGLVSMSFGIPDEADAITVLTPLDEHEKSEQATPPRRPQALTALDEIVGSDPASQIRSKISTLQDPGGKFGDHYETDNPELEDVGSALGNPDSKTFLSGAGNMVKSGGGGTGGDQFAPLVGISGSGGIGEGGGFGGGTGTGIGAEWGGNAGSFGQRSGAGRRRLLIQHGGTPGTESAVESALSWLARHQSPDGHWDIRKIGGPRVEMGYANDECIAPLAVLAFLGAGHTPRTGRFKETVDRAIQWLMRRQHYDGSMMMSDLPTGTNASSGSYNYAEALTTLALSEAYGMTGDAHIKEAAQAGVNALARTQEAAGNWSHWHRTSTSVTGWAVMALKSAALVHLDVPQKCFSGAMRWFDHVSERDKDGYYGRVGYDAPKGYYYNQGYTMTAVGMVCLQFMNHISDIPAQVELVMKDPPRWSGKLDYQGPPRNFYYWYYGTLGIFQTGGEYWTKWNSALQETLLPNQCRDPLAAHDGGFADLDGSWPATGTWDDAGGRVYTTAMGALCLEVYYRYLQVGRK